jgi:hypothetical protein
MVPPEGLNGVWDREPEESTPRFEIIGKEPGMSNYNSPRNGGYEDPTTGLVLGALGGAAYGYLHWGTRGLAAGVAGAVVGAMLETALTAGNAGRATLLLAMVPIGLLALVAYVVATYFR